MRSLLAALIVCSSVAACAANPDLGANTRTAKRVFFEKMGEGRFDKLDEIYGPGFVAHARPATTRSSRTMSRARSGARRFPTSR